MTIEKTEGYKIGTKFFPTLKEAQVEALRPLFTTVIDEMRTTVAEMVVDNADAIIAIINPPKELRMRAIRKDKGTKRGARTIKGKDSKQPDLTDTQSADKTTKAAPDTKA